MKRTAPKHKSTIQTVADAEAEFGRRTGLDPYADPVIGAAVLNASVAEITESIRTLAAWTKPLRAATRDVPAGPAAWAVKRLDRVVLQLGAAAQHAEGEEVPVGHLYVTAVAVARKLADLRSAAADLLVKVRHLDRDTQGARREVEGDYKDAGTSWAVKTPGHRPIDWPIRRLINTLHNRRARAGLRDLTATEVALLAVCLGFDEPPGDELPKLVAKWAKRIRDAKRAT